ncbi:ATP-binding protein [Streptomyces sp. NPDC005263]|uniref:ATP-binding protein n=1 Tax=Streptomyces sp. NPDC005263 TaxID=3364711 RepID=UPI0036CB524E
MNGIRIPAHGSVARRLAYAFGLLTLLIALTGTAMLIGTLRLSAAQDRITHRVHPAVDDNLRLRNESVTAQRSIRGYLITGDQIELAAFHTAKNRIPSVISDLRGHGVADENNVATQQREIQAYLRVADQQALATPRSDQAATLTRKATLRFRAFERTNDSLTRQLNDQDQDLERHANTVFRAGVAGLGAVLVLAVGGAVYMSLRTTRALIGPLGDVERTLHRLTDAEHSARAREEGPSEIRAVARSVNTLADEGDRLRAIGEERDALAEMARKTGLLIREHLEVDHVLDTACTGIGEGLQADYVFIMLLEEGNPLVPVARAWNARRGLLPAEEQTIPPVPAEVVREHYQQGTTWSYNRLDAHLDEESPLPGAPGSYGDTGLPEEARAAARALGLVSAVVAPMGVGEEPLGAVFVARTRPEKVWRPVEVEMVDSMASGVGRAVYTSSLYEQETRLVDKLRALDQAKSDFLSTVSHELRTPLTSIVGYIELLKDEETGPLTPPQMRMLDVVDRNANRLRALIEDLLTLSRIESGAFTSKRAPVDVRRLVASAADAMRPAADAASVALEIRCAEQPLVLEADGDQLDRVLMNLLSNAVKFTPTGGTVTVRADAQDGAAVLSVSDTGIGIPEAEQRKLFERFFRASNATDAAIPGTGLGLTIVRTIVANHGGEMEVHSEEGRGTTFTARLPLAAADRLPESS